MSVEHYEINGYPVTVINLWDREPDECPMCGAIGYHDYAVPWYCGPVPVGCSEGGYKSVCKECHDKWDRWDDSFRYYGA